MHGHWSEWFSPQMKGLNPGRLKKSKPNSTPQNVEFTVKYTFHSSSPYKDDLTVTNNRKKSSTIKTKDIFNSPHSMSQEIQNEFSKEKMIHKPKVVTFEEDKDIFKRIAHSDYSNDKNSIKREHEDSFILHTKETNNQDEKETDHQDGKETNHQDGKKPNNQDGEENINQNESRGPLIGTMMTYYNMLD